jgi:site-specific DNA-methyltransferase (adenine-specific)
MDIKTNDLWLMQGDCLERMKEIESGSVDMVLADVPYGTTQNKWDAIIPLEPMWEQLKRIIKPNGAIVMTASQPFTTTIISSNTGMFKYCWVWEKNLKTGNLNARKMPMGGHEDVVVFYSKPPTYNPQKRKRTTEVKSGNKKNSKTTNYGVQKEDYIDRQSDEINPDTVIKGIKCVHNSSGKQHPTQKPVELMEYLIKTYTDETQKVLDFTMGSGTTGVAARNLNRKFIGIELDETYFKIAKDRITGDTL